MGLKICYRVYFIDISVGATANALDELVLVLGVPPAYVGGQDAAGACSRSAVSHCGCFLVAQ
jgi:hypothetical protein